MKLFSLIFLLLTLTATIGFAEDRQTVEQPAETAAVSSQLPELPVGKGTIGMTCRSADGHIVSFDPGIPIQVTPAPKGVNCAIEQISQQEMSELSSDI